ncbi:DUF2339 domain-containing protein [Chitinophaga pinensis]|uniref:DUF2339 domain-containing protein n=1 Tax=Chitinophaga pinensis TaxID=79329 RepID=A0A5C6LNT4_9BACT|nr:DUF2339 domain-containing protein [Chitinophaga pinensis]TWV96812.1 DUF2339 domain-containing protein [Chitinophaga pinensis]
MAVITFILLIVILIIVINTGNALKSKLVELEYKLERLLRQQQETGPPSASEAYTPRHDWDRQATVRPESRPYTPPPIVEDVPPPPPPPVTVTPVIDIPATPEPVSATPASEAAFTAYDATPVENEASGTADISGVSEQAAAFTPAPPMEPTPSFWEKNPDLEKFIGENLFNKIGIAILVIGIGFFLKYAIDNNWINETGRTFIGILCGGILIGVAHRLRKTFNAFSSVLVGGGVAVLYFSITIAFQQYHLISQTLAFIMMILITAFTVVLSLSYDRKELAVFAILGGFSSPLLISTGAGNATVLFSYILILNVGMLILAYYKKWNIVNIISYAATIILFGSWLLIGAVKQATPPYITALVFATLFYIIFFLMNVVNNLKQRVPFKATEIIVLLSNTFLYYAAGMLILSHIQHGMFQGLFTACIAIFNFIFAYSLYRNQHADKNLIYLLIGLTLSFLSLAAPVQLNGNHITLFWAAEAVLLLWLFMRSRLPLMKYAACIVFVLMTFSLLMDWEQVYGDLRYAQSHNMWPFLNQGFITGAVCTTAVFMIRHLLKKETEEKFLPEIPASAVRYAFGLLAVILIYTTGILELYYQTDVHWPAINPICSGIYNYAFLAFVLYRSRKEHALLQLAGIILSAISFIVFIAYYNWVIIDVRTAYLEANKPLAHFLLSYLLMVGLLTMLYQAYLTVKASGKKDVIHIFQWVATFVLLYVLSASLDHIVALASYRPGIQHAELENTSQRMGYSILWGAFAFVLIYLGFRWQSKQVRIISISLFALTLLKLFVFDLRNLSEGGKIAAFISLGILLLVISFMYQRLKKILLTDEDKTAS